MLAVKGGIYSFDGPVGFNLWVVPVHTRRVLTMTFQVNIQVKVDVAACLFGLAAILTVLI